MFLSRTQAGRVPEALLRHDKYVAKTWSGPGGWTKTARRVISHFLNGAGCASCPPVLPWRGWFCLTLPSVLMFIALPLSGLSFEPESGFIRGLADVRGPNITCFTYSNFNERPTGEVSTAAQIAWKNAIDDRLPAGALPKNSGVSQVFLTAQAETPVDGTSWGLSLQHNCSIIDKISDLTLLKRLYREGSTTSAPKLPLQPLFVGPGNDGGVLVNQTLGSMVNMYGAIEYSFKEWPTTAIIDRLFEEDPRWSLTKTSRCYFNQLQNVTGDYHDADQESILEIILWQHLEPAGRLYPPPNYNFTIDHNITSLYGAYRLAGDGELLQGQNGKANNSVPMTAIGVSCTSSAAVGTAIVDGARSIFFIPGCLFSKAGQRPEH